MTGFAALNAPRIHGVCGFAASRGLGGRVGARFGRVCSRRGGGDETIGARKAERNAGGEADGGVDSSMSGSAWLD